FGEQADRRVSADRVIALAYDARAVAGDIARQRTAREPRAEKIDDVGIAKQVVEEGLHGVRGSRPAQLEQHNADFFPLGHLGVASSAVGCIIFRLASGGEYRPSDSPCVAPPTKRIRKTRARSQCMPPPENLNSS